MIYVEDKEYWTMNDVARAGGISLQRFNQHCDNFGTPRPTHTPIGVRCYYNTKEADEIIECIKEYNRARAICKDPWGHYLATHKYGKK